MLLSKFTRCRQNKLIIFRNRPYQKKPKMEYFLHRRHQAQILEGAKQKISRLLARVWNIGYSTTLEDYEKRKLGIFNQLNFFQIITGILVPIVAFLTSKKFPLHDWYIAILPSCISIIALLLNSFNKY